jgi:hypothetical protein
MSSIAYVADEEMLEFDRLCASRNILFWRLSVKRKISDFFKGDLLFFFARPKIGRKKALLGYAHYDSTRRLSLKQMWEQYGEATGYSDYQRLHDAIEKAAIGKIPRTMRCLYLTDVVFFSSPLYPDEVGLKIPNNLESYQYLDRDDPKITVRVLQAAEKKGIDLWSQDSTRNPADIFRDDETRQMLAVIANEIGVESGSEKERGLMHRLAKERAEKPAWEPIRGSRTDCLHLTATQIHIALPFAAQANDRDTRIRECIGRIAMYRLRAQSYHIDRKIYFELLGDKIPENLAELVEQINHE